MCKEIKRNLSQESLHLKRRRLLNGAEITFHPKLVNQKHPFPRCWCCCCCETGWGNERLMFQFLTSSLDLQCLRSCRLLLPISKPFTVLYALNNNNDLTLKRKAKNCAPIHTREILPNIILSLLISRLRVSKFLHPLWKYKIYVRLHTRWYERLPKDFLRLRWDSHAEKSLLDLRLNVKNLKRNFLSKSFWKLLSWCGKMFWVGIPVSSAFWSDGN